MKEKKLGINKYILLSVLVLFIISLIGVTSVLARYIDTNKSSSSIYAEDFIFVCNYEDGKTYHVYYDETKITTSIRNYIGAYRNESDITGTITVNKLDSLGTATLVVKDNFTLSKDLNDHQEIESNVGTLVAGEKYQLVVETTVPYKKVIKAELVVMTPEAASYYSITDKGTYVELEINIGAVIPTDDIRINFGSLIPDTTNEYMSSWTATSGYGIIEKEDLTANSTIILIFLETMTVEYSNITNANLTDTISINVM